MALVRVFMIPKPLPRDYHFAGSELVPFLEVDWFRDDLMQYHQLTHDQVCAELSNFIKGKLYYRDNLSFLVLHPEHSFTINYEAP